jgi:hypothetical protein
MLVPVKEVKKGVFTVCDYYTTGILSYLGGYQDSTFFSSDPPSLEHMVLFPIQMLSPLRILV